MLHTCILATAFLSPPWRNTLILITASVLIYPYLPSPQKYSASPSVSPEKFASSLSPDSDAPLVTRLLAKYTPESKVWTERNDKHLELSAEKAEERLLFQEAERPKVHRMRYPRYVSSVGIHSPGRGLTSSHFEQASPHCLPVGGSVDLSDLQVKRV